MKLTEFMTCWRECVPAEFSIDLEQLKVYHILITRFFCILNNFIEFCSYF